MPEGSDLESTPAASPSEAPDSLGPRGPSPQGPAPRRSRTLRIVIWVLILAGFIVLCWAILRHKPAAAGAARPGQRSFSGPVTVNAATAKTGDMGVYLQAIGTVTPVHTDTITSQATGMITAVEYRQGQFVRRGQRLIQIDPRPYQAQVLTAEGNLERDMGLLSQARMDLARYQAAWKQNSIALQILQDQEKIVTQQEGAVKADRGVLALDKVQLGYCSITAPISGRIGLRLVDPGNVVQANSTTPLAVITEVEPITVVFTIPEGDVAEVEKELRAGRRLQVGAYDRSNEQELASGYLDATDNLIDTTTGTLKLRAVFSNRDHHLFPNLFVNTRLLLRTLHNVVMVPDSAVQQNGDISFVYLIRDGVAHIKNIAPGVTDHGMTQAGGLEAGDEVADSGFQRLQDGSRVKVTQQSLLPQSTGGTPQSQNKSSSAP